MFDIFYQGNNQSLLKYFPFAKQVKSKDEIKSKTRMFWFVEPNIEITDLTIFDFEPDQYTNKYNHVWKWSQHSYGGVWLHPRVENKETVWHNDIKCKKTFDILHTETPEDYFDNNTTATHVWCVDPEYVLDNDINWAPSDFEPNFIHSFHLRGQLEHKYPEVEGGVKLYPRDWQQADIKYHTFLDANVTYPILYVEDVNDYVQRDILPDEYVWLIDREHKINVKTVDWVPNPFENGMLHTFRMPYQLEEKYPMAMGGIRLVPKDWKNAETKIHPACPIEDENYDVFYVDDDEFDADTYSEYALRSQTDWFWIVDRQHTFTGKLLFVPGSHEQEYIHVFKIPGHLEERYPLQVEDAWDNRCGGVRLVHKQFDITKHKFQKDVVPVRYDIFYTNNLNDYETFARKSRTKMFWMVDEEHQINEVFRYVPQSYDKKFIHIFKMPGDLDHKYPSNIKNVSDNRCGGIKLVPVKYNSEERKYFSDNPVGGRNYPIVFKDVMDEYETATEDCWFVSNGIEVDVITWNPPVFEKEFVHIFGSGLVRWVPGEWNGEIKNHEFTPSSNIPIEIEWEKFDTYEQGVEQSTHNWFWVIDKDIDILEDFDFAFQPDAFDEGKRHVWQKLNPKTNKQYDYGGIQLCHKSEKSGRPKYLRTPGCMQHEYPVYHIQPDDHKEPLQGTYERLANQTNTNMFWIVDTFTNLNPDFNFDYYPTQWDIDKLHIFADEDDNFRNVRLVPTELFKNSKFTNKDIDNNSFDNLKEVRNVASLRPKWPVFELESADKQTLLSILNNDSPYVWTVDPNVEVNNDILDVGFMPRLTELSNIHCWQKLNSTTQKVHAYGGLRLWPTFIDYENLKSDDIRLNKFRNLTYVKEVGSTTKTNDIVYISYKEPLADKHFNNLQDKLRQINPKFNLIWVRDIEGIFEAHKVAASRVSSKMFWVVDADAEIKDDFIFDYIPDVYDEDVVHVWASSNPVTGEEYGYGGVKLFNTEQVREATSWGLDFTTGLSKRFKAMPQVSCVTRFNTSEYDTWRSAFRECVKLTLKDDQESKDRLTKWLNPLPDADFSEQAKAGATDGRDFANKNKMNISELNMINDYEWLYEQYNKTR